LRGVSKDGRELVAHPSRLAVKDGEHLRMTAAFSFVIGDDAVPDGKNAALTR
jgi:hypothetical protein